MTPSWGNRSLGRRLDKGNLVRLKPHDSLTVRGTAFFRRVLGVGAVGPRRQRQGPSHFRAYGLSELKLGGAESTAAPPGLRSCGTLTVAVPSQVAPNWSVAVKCTR
jgi:hypothetical protein